MCVDLDVLILSFSQDDKCILRLELLMVAFFLVFGSDVTEAFDSIKSYLPEVDEQDFCVLN